MSRENTSNIFLIGTLTAYINSAYYQLIEPT
jgi:hypothetical protein